MNRRSFLETGATAALALTMPRWMRASATPSRCILYVAGEVNRTLVDTLGPSQFNVVILAFLYVRHRAGRLELHYNATPVRALRPETIRELERLRRGFPIRKQVLISLGGWGNASTFAAIRSAGVPHFLEQLDREVVAPLGLEGLDLDLEPGTVAENTPAGWHAVHDEFGTTLIELTNGYMARHPGHVVTHAPIAGMAAALYARDGKVRGVRGSIFEACRTPTGNNLAWLNVQFYEAGDPKPVSIPDFYKNELLLPLERAAATTGVARPWERLIPGFEPRYRQTLDVCRANLRAIHRELAAPQRVGGCFLWDYRQIAAAVPEWSSGLVAVLE